MVKEKKGFESPISGGKHKDYVRGDNEEMGRHEGRKADFARKHPRHKKRGSTRK